VIGGLVDLLLVLAKYGPVIATLVKLLEGGNVTPEETTDALLKLEADAVEARLRAKYPGQV
jgi:hypothetical protein